KGKHPPALGPSQGPFWGHDGFSCQTVIALDDFPIVLAEEKIVHKGPIGEGKRVPVPLLPSKIKLRLIGVVKENPIVVTAHKERNALVKRVFRFGITGLVTVPHGIGVPLSVQSPCFFPEAQNMLILPQYFGGPY